MNEGERSFGLDCVGIIHMSKTYYTPDPPPRAVVHLGQAAGALEGLIAGWIYGGVNAVPVAVLVGAAIGAFFSVIAWRFRRRARQYAIPLLVCLLIEIVGGVLIVLNARWLGMNPPLPGVERFFLMVIVPPDLILFLRLLRREILAAYRGLVAGVSIGSISIGILIGAIAAQGIGGGAAIVLFVLGGIAGVLTGSAESLVF